MRKPFELVFKALIVIGAAILIYQRLNEDQYQGIFSYSWKAAYWIVPVFLFLWIQNLFLDAAIWRKVHHFISSLPWRRAFKTNIICYALAFITPANSGELAGRYVMLKGVSSRQKTIFLTFWSHFPRLIVKFVLGGAALLWIAQETGKVSATTALVGALLVSLSFLAWYFLFIRIQRWLHSRGFRNIRFSKHLLNDRPGFREKISLLIISCLKYLTYNAQFVLLLVLWGGANLSLEMLASVIVFYFVSALVPTFAAADFLIKAALAMFIFDPVIADNSLIINASFIVWAFNIAIPALAGTLIIFKTNLGHSIRKKFSHGNLYGS